jgi:hypothetical protein
MKTMTRRVPNSWKRCRHKRYKIWTTKIKIKTTKKVINSYNQEGEKGKQQST